jgi:hypothetical protein
MPILISKIDQFLNLIIPGNSIWYGSCKKFLKKCTTIYKMAQKRQKKKKKNVYVA